MSLSNHTEQVVSVTSQGPSQEAWSKHRAEITRLYLRKEMPLAELVRVMARDHNFHATARMFKFRFKTWKLDRNLRPEEVLAMSRVETRRKTLGTGSDFWRHGRPVTAGKLERYLRDHPHVAAQLKKSVPQDALMKGHIEALLPPHIVVLTPSPSLVFDQNLHSLEGLLGSLTCYLYEEFIRTRSLFESDSTLIIPDASVWNAIRVQNDSILPTRIANSILLDGFDLLYGALMKGGLAPFLTIVSNYLNVKGHRPEIAMLWLNQARDVCAIIKGYDHPLSIAMRTIVNSADEIEESNILQALMNVIFDKFGYSSGEECDLMCLIDTSVLNLMHCSGVSQDNLDSKGRVKLQNWINKLEESQSPGFVVGSIVKLLIRSPSIHQELGASFLERCLWQRHVPGWALTTATISCLYWQLEDFENSIMALSLSLNALKDAWLQSQFIDGEAHDLFMLGCIGNLLNIFHENFNNDDRIHDLIASYEEFVKWVRDWYDKEDSGT